MLQFHDQDFKQLIGWVKPQKKEIKLRKTFVYFIKSRRRDEKKFKLKIGHSVSPKMRQYTFGDQYERITEILALIEFENKSLAIEIERHLCNRFRKSRAYLDSYEWFETQEVKTFLSEIGLSNYECL